MNILTQIFYNPFAVATAFPKPVRDQIQQAIANGEKRHRGEVCFVIETHVPFLSLLRGSTPRDRAIRAFHKLGAHDTKEHNAVLIYLCMAGRHIEIVADTGLADKVMPSEWDRLIRASAVFFAKGDFANGALLAIGDTHDLLIRHFPGSGSGNEMADTIRMV